MKKCFYCGTEYPDDAVECALDRTPFVSPNAPPPPELAVPEFTFAPLSAADKQKTLVTLLSCRTLMAADLIVARLRAVGMAAFIPDESLMQMIGWNLNTYGYVRVQVSPLDYDAARELLSGVESADEA